MNVAFIKCRFGSWLMGFFLCREDMEAFRDAVARDLWQLAISRDRYI